MTKLTFDPVMLEVIWNRLISIVEEEAKTLIRTSFTNILSDAGDLSAGLFDTKGNMLAQAVTGTPGHINTMATGVRHFLRHHPVHTLEPGDVLLGNNPYDISGHLMDLTVVTPVFYAGKLVGLFASCCHTLDIGGLGFTTEGESVYEEGLHIPYLKYYRKGRLNEDLQSIIAHNTRTPYEVLGDLRAQVIANEVASQRLLEVMEEFGLTELDSLGAEIIRRSEEGMRRAIAEIPDGKYESEIFSDGVDEPVLLRCTLHIQGDEITVDFSGSSPASRKGINVCLNYTHAYVTFALKGALAPDIPNNEGSFRPIHVTAPEGCILNAKAPMPVTGRHIVGHFTSECVLRALYHAVPDRVLAEGATSIWIIQVMGQKQDGQTFSYVTFTAGGMGARPDKDGLSATAFPSGIRGTPVEIIESSSPIIIHQKELKPDSGGPGKYRGGLGQVIRIGVRTGNPWRFPTMYDRTRFAPRGLAGGGDGAKGGIYLNGTQPLAPKHMYNLEPDDIVTLHLPGGGGYGDPAQRDPQQVLADVINGYVSPESARRDYLVAVVKTDAGWEIDEHATSQLRAGSGGGVNG